MLFAVSDTIPEIPIGLGEPALTAQDGVEIRVGAARLRLQALGDPDLQRPVHRSGPVSALIGGGGTALGVERVTEYLGQVQRLGQRLRRPGQPDRGIVLPSSIRWPASLAYAQASSLLG